MRLITIRPKIRDGTEVLVAQGPSPHDIARLLHERLVAAIDKKIDMEVARQLVRLGWTPPPGHPVLDEPITKESQP